MDTFSNTSRAASILNIVCKHFSVTYEQLKERPLPRRFKKIRASLVLRMRMSGVSSKEIARTLCVDRATVHRLIKFAASEDSIASLAYPSNNMSLDVVNKVVAKRAMRSDSFLNAVSALRPKDKKCVEVLDFFFERYHKDLSRVKVLRYPALGVDPFEQTRRHAARYAFKHGRCSICSIARCLRLSYATAEKYCTLRA